MDENNNKFFFFWKNEKTSKYILPANTFKKTNTNYRNNLNYVLP